MYTLRKENLSSTHFLNTNYSYVIMTIEFMAMRIFQDKLVPVTSCPLYGCLPVTGLSLDLVLYSQLTGVLIGAAVAVSLIGLVILFLYRRHKLARESPSLYICVHFVFGCLRKLAGDSGGKDVVRRAVCCLRQWPLWATQVTYRRIPPWSYAAEMCLQLQKQSSKGSFLLFS